MGKELLNKVTALLCTGNNGCRWSHSLGPSITVPSQVLSIPVLIMMRDTIFEYLLGWLYENHLIRAETLNSAHGIDLIRKILLSVS